MRTWNPKTVSRRKFQSLDGYRCPECKTGELKFDDSGTNVCDNCGCELITEWEWERRQKEAA